MPVYPIDYYASPRFNPVAELTQVRLENAWWRRFPDKPSSTTSDAVSYEIALPTAANVIPSPNLYAPTAPDLFAANSFLPGRSAQQQLWDSLGFVALSRAPDLSELFADLSTRGGGQMTTPVWQDFRRSSEFRQVTLAMQAHNGNLTGRAVRGLTKVLKTGGRLITKFGGLLFDVPNPTPAGVAIAIVKEVGQTVALNLAQKGAVGVLDYLRDYRDDVWTPPPAPPYEPPTRPPLPGEPPIPVYKPTPAFWDRPWVSQHQSFMAFRPTLDGPFKSEHIPMLWSDTPTKGFPSGLMNFNGYFR
jgi:hypothetical protein